MIETHNKSTHNKQEEKQEESWRAPNIMRFEKRF